jgi:hypothetical protein
MCKFTTKFKFKIQNLKMRKENKKKRVKPLIRAHSPFLAHCRLATTRSPTSGRGRRQGGPHRQPQYMCRVADLWGPGAVAGRHAFPRRLCRLRVGSSRRTCSPTQAGRCDIAALVARELGIGTIRALGDKSRS